MTFQTKRILYTVLASVAVVFLPWYVYAPLLCVGMIVFHNFIEAVVLAVIADLLFGFTGGSMMTIKYFTTSIIGIVFLLSVVFRDKLRFIND